MIRLLATVSRQVLAPALGLLALTACGDRIREAPALDSSGMIAIATTSFDMGHEDATPGPYGAYWKENELPQHPVELSAFLVDRTEVTVSDWVDFLATEGEAHHHPLQPVDWTGSSFAPRQGWAERPIVQVSWYDATVYCAWVGKQLPTEAQWELAARGEDGRRFPWAEGGASCELAVHTTSAAPCADEPEPVGSRSPAGDSPHGLADMAGNVAEWVADRYGRYEDDLLVDPRGPEEGAFRVVRGGSFLERPDALRTTSRWGANPAHRSRAVGFRCAAEEGP